LQKKNRSSRNDESDWVKYQWSIIHHAENVKSLWTKWKQISASGESLARRSSNPTGAMTPPVGMPGLLEAKPSEGEKPIEVS